VVYLVDDKPCAVRLRNTTSHEIWPSQIWQLDFCKIIEYQWEGINGFWIWRGKPDVLCAAKWPLNENYVDPDFTKLRTTCNFGSGTALGLGYAVAFQENWDAYMFATGKLNMNLRSQQRLMASFKYIEKLLTGKPY
jgi:hypothetical protein